MQADLNKTQTINDLPILSVYPTCYCSQLRCYLINSSVAFSKIQQNNIPLRELALTPQLKQVATKCLEAQKHPTNNFRCLYAEQILYLTMISCLPDYTQLHNDHITQTHYQQLKQNDITAIYLNLDEEAYEKYEIMHFYIKHKKKSKILVRQLTTIPTLPIYTPALFKVYKTVQDYRNDQKPQFVLVVLASQPLATVLQVRTYLQMTLTIEILANMDGTALNSKVPFPIPQN